MISAAAHWISLSSGVENWNLGALLGLPEYMNGIWYLSLLTVGVAYLAGKGGFFFVVGGYVCYWILAPMLNLQGRLPSADTLDGGGDGRGDLAAPQHVPAGGHRDDHRRRAHRHRAGAAARGFGDALACSGRRRPAPR